MIMSRTICWFSCGATSAVAAYLTLKRNPEAHIVYIDTGSEHPDNVRFLRDCERWFGKEIEIIKSAKFNNVDEVIEKRRYLNGINGAPCTGELKKVPRMAYQQPDDVHVFGFHTGERERAQRFRENNFEMSIETPLIDAMLDHADCVAMLRNVGIEPPIMYALGYHHSNCLGCVKSSGAGYWNKIRIDFPDVFARRAAQERKFNHALVKVNGDPIFLDELPSDIGKYEAEPEQACSILCQIALNQ